MNEDQELGARLRRLESTIIEIPNFQNPSIDHEPRVEPVTSPLAASSSIAANLTKVVITWISVEDAIIDRYEVWVERLTDGAPTPYLAASVKDSPAAFNIVSDAAGHGLAYIRTFTKAGLSTPLTASPSVVFEVF